MKRIVAKLLLVGAVVGFTAMPTPAPASPCPTFYTIYPSFCASMCTNAGCGYDYDSEEGLCRCI